MASQVPPVRGVAFDLYFTFFKSDGTVIANPGTITKKISKDDGAVADIAGSVLEQDNTYGKCKLTLSAEEMTADAVWYYLKDDTTGCVPIVGVIYTTNLPLNSLGSDLTTLLDRLTLTRAGYLDQLEHIHDDTNGAYTTLNDATHGLAALKTLIDSLNTLLSVTGIKVASNTDKSGYSLTEAYERAKTAANSLEVSPTVHVDENALAAAIAVLLPGVDVSALATALAPLMPAPIVNNNATATVDVNALAEDLAPLMPAPLVTVNNNATAEVDTNALATELAPLLPAPVVTVEGGSVVVVSAVKVNDAEVTYLDGNTITYAVGDQKPDLAVALKDSVTGLPLDLTDLISATLIIGDRFQNEILTADMGVLGDPTAGILRYLWGPEDLVKSGSFKIQIVLTWAGNKEQTLPLKVDLTLNVKDRVAYETE